ncbi:hypothetical protein JTB14_000864 [Gonioctena quinquepunctata]|nr:hypothetical protein JTB14_000864 [Gonioctena quinquepunctata]
MSLEGVLSEFRDVESAKLKVDNSSAISMIRSYENSKRTKHIDIKEHFIKDLESSIIRDQVIFGIRDLHVKEVLPRDENITLGKVSEYCRAVEVSKQQIEEFQREASIILKSTLRSNLPETLSNIIQKEGQAFDSYLTELKNSIPECVFGDQESSIIRDQVIYGIRDLHVKEVLLRDGNITLGKVSEYCRAVEVSKQQIEEFQREASVNINVVKRKSVNRDVIDDCNFRGYSHRIRNCPAFGEECGFCKKKGHFRKTKRIFSRYRKMSPNLMIMIAGRIPMNIILLIYTKDGIWEPGTVIGEHQSPRSYIVEDDSGKILRRNIKLLETSFSDFNKPSDESSEGSGRSEGRVSRMIRKHVRFDDYILS